MYLSFPVALGGLSVLMAAGIALAFFSGHGDLAWVVVPIVAILAVWFLASYSERPGPETVQEPAAGAIDDEPFEDPVEEADRVATDAPQAPATEEAEVPPAAAPAPSAPVPSEGPSP